MKHPDHTIGIVLTCIKPYDDLTVGKSYRVIEGPYGEPTVLDDVNFPIRINYGKDHPNSYYQDFKVREKKWWRLWK